MKILNLLDCGLHLIDLSYPDIFPLNNPYNLFSLSGLDVDPLDNPYNFAAL